MDRVEAFEQIVAHYGAVELDQLVELRTDEPTPKALIVAPYLLVETGRAGARVWYYSFPDICLALQYAAARAKDDEWGFAALYDLDTGEEIPVAFAAERVQELEVLVEGEVPERGVMESGDTALAVAARRSMKAGHPIAIDFEFTSKEAVAFMGCSNPPPVPLEEQTWRVVIEARVMGWL